MHQQLCGYKVEDKLYLGIREKKVEYRCSIRYYKLPCLYKTLDSMLSQLNPSYNLSNYLFRILFNIILPSPFVSFASFD
jgi:hypothetical protein